MIRRTLWLLLIAALATAGLPGIWAHVEWRSPVFRDAHATTDEIAQQLLQMDDGTAALAKEIAKIPRNQALMVVGPGNNWQLVEVHYLLSDLAWPRPVWALGQTTRGGRSIYSVLPETGVQPAAMLFYQLSPPPELQARARHLTTELIWVPLTD